MLVPRMLVSVAAGGGTPVPSISALTATDEREISCLNTWRVTVAWTILNADNTNYKLKLVEGSTVLSDTLDNASGNYLYNTGQLGDPLLFEHELALTFTLQVVRRSDNVIVASSDVGTNKFYGDCP